MRRDPPEQPLLGAHLSIAGGLHNAVAAAVELRCTALQIFSKSSNQWKAKPLLEDDVRSFRSASAASPVRVCVVHDSYLINLASPREELRRKSIDAFHEEMERVERLGLPSLIMHPGAHMGAGEDAGLCRVASAFDEVHERTRGLRMRVLIETTAGQGTTLGRRFEQIRRILDIVREPERLGVCLDTCHVFAAGYDIRTSQGWKDTLDEFERWVGMDRLEAIHLNDSARPLGSRVDRHAHIGTGHIGLEPFRAIMNDPRLAAVPKIIETPKEGGHEKDRQNLATLLELAGSPLVKGSRGAAPRVATFPPLGKGD